MGQCVSCREPSPHHHNNAKTSRSSGQIHSSQGSKSSVSGRSADRSLTSGHSRGRDYAVTSPRLTDMSQSMAAPERDRRAFRPYQKLPPIKKSTNNNDTKRQSKELSYDQKLNGLFDHYKDKEEDAILADGTLELCSDLEVDPEDYRILVLAWKFKAETMCRFTRVQFVTGFKLLRVDSIAGLRARLADLLIEVRDRQAFRDMYRWAYKFSLDADTGQRTLPTDTAIAMWQIIFSESRPTILSRWLAFLKKHTDIRGIPKDTWDMFLNFTEQVGTDLSNYDDTEAWPSLFDDFVEYENDLKNQNVSNDGDVIEC